MSNNIEKLVESYIPEIQELNDAALSFLIDLFLDNADGVQLDGIGTIIGVERLGLNDEQYRARLQAQIRVNTSSGTIEDVITSMALAIGVTSGLELIEGAPAEFAVSYPTILNNVTAIVIAEIMYQAKAGGVHAIFQYHAAEPIFAFDGDGGAKFDGGYYLKTAIRNRAGRESEIL